VTTDRALASSSLAVAVRTCTVGRRQEEARTGRTRRHASARAPSGLSWPQVLEHGLPPHRLAAVHHHHLIVFVAAADVRAHEAGGYGGSWRGQRLDQQLPASTDGSHGRRGLAPAAAVAVRERDPPAAVPQQRHALRGEDGRRPVPVPAPLPVPVPVGAEATERRARGPVHRRGEQPGGAPRQDDGDGGGLAVGRRRLLSGELEDLEAVLGDGDAHAEEELVVQVAHVGGAELVAREEQRVLQGHVRVQPHPAEPRVPVHRPSGEPATAASEPLPRGGRNVPVLVCSRWAGGVTYSPREPDGRSGCWLDGGGGRLRLVPAHRARTGGPPTHPRKIGACVRARARFISWDQVADSCASEAHHVRILKRRRARR
jgi:hypothetical protein